MPNENDKCPKCGSVASTNHAAFTEFECDSTMWSNALAERCQYMEKFEQSDHCKITTLEAENAKLREALLLTIVEGRHIFRKGFVEDAGLKALGLSAISEAIQQLQAARASALLEKKGTKE